MKSFEKAIKKYKKIIAIVTAIFFGLVAIYICFYKLGKPALENWDEAFYADVTRSMLRTREFFVLYWNRVVFLDKPPLYMWLSAITVKIIGMSEFALRFTSAVAGFLTIIMVVIYAYRSYGIIPALVSFSTLALNNIYIWRVRSGNLDSLLVFLIVCSYFLMIGKNKYRYVLLGLIFGLMFLTKLSVVLFPLGIFIVSEILYENIKIIFKIPHYVIMGLLFVFLSGFWLQMGMKKAGPEFYDYYMNRGDQGVSAISISNLKTDYLSYTYYSLQRRLFWVVVVGLIAAICSLKKRRYFVEILFAAGLLIQLSMTEKNNNWYLLPSIPFWSLLGAYGTYWMMKIANKIKLQYIFIPIFLLVVCYISYKTFTVNINAIIDTAGPEKLKQSSLKVKSLSKETDTIARLDHLYPATVFYTDRKVYASPDGGSGTFGSFMSREDVMNKIKKKEIQWIMGLNGDVESFLKNQDVGTYQVIKPNDEEMIIKVL